MIQTSGINRTIALLNSDLAQIAVGDGVTPSVSATALSNETFRKPVTTSVVDGAVLIKEVFLDETDANGLITEIGIIGSTNELFASGSASIIKDNTQSLTISFEIEVKEVT